MHETRYYTKDGRTAVVDVRPNGTVTVAVEVLDEMLQDLGFTRSSRIATDHPAGNGLAALAAANDKLASTGEAS